MSETMHWLMRRRLGDFVKVLVIAAMLVPGLSANGDTQQNGNTTTPSFGNSPNSATNASSVALPPEITPLPPVPEIPGGNVTDRGAGELARQRDDESKQKAPGARDSDPEFQIEIISLDGFLSALREGVSAALKSPEHKIADILFTSFSWTTQARIAAHHSGSPDLSLEKSLVGDLDRLVKCKDLAKMDFAKQLLKPRSLLTKSLQGKELALRNQLLLTKKYPVLKLVEIQGGRLAPAATSAKSGSSKLGYYRIPEDQIKNIEKALDEIDRTVEEWGRASVSGFELIDNNAVNGGQGFFNLNYNQPTEFYMDQVRQNVQGGVATLIQKTVTGQLQAQLTQNQPLLSSNSPATSTTTTTTTSINSTNSSTNTTTTTTASSTNAPSSSTGSAGFGLTNFPVSSVTNVGPAGYLSLLPQADTAPQLSEKDVLAVGASDKEIERVLNFMSDPINLPNNQRAYLCVMQVSVSPGWRTKRGYVGEVQLTFRYGASAARKKERLKRLKDTRGVRDILNRDGESITDPMLEKDTGIAPDTLMQDLEFDQEAYPAVLSVFPFADAQSLDFQSSLQKQLNLLLQMSASLQKVSAQLQSQLLASYQKLVRQDSATRNLLPLVVPSSRGNDVTYRFDPEFQALEEPGNPESKAGQVLQPSSFPALVVLVCDEDEVLDYDQIISTTETRWLPAKHRNWWKSHTYDWLTIDARPGIPLYDEARFRSAKNLDLIEETLETKCVTSRSRSIVYEEAWRRFYNLKSFAVGRNDINTLPAVTPEIAAVYPASFRRDFMPTNLTAFCRYVDTSDDRFQLKQVTLGGVVITNPFVKNSHFIEIELPANRKDFFQPGGYDLEVVSAQGPAILSNAVTVFPVPAPVITAVFPTNLQQVIVAKTKTGALQVEFSLPGLFEWPPLANKFLETITAAIKGGGQQTAPSLETEKLVIEQQDLTIAGGNLYVGDDSLRVVIGGMALANAAKADWKSEETLKCPPPAGAKPPAATGRGAEAPGFVSMERHDTFLTLHLGTNSLSELKPGKYNVAVVTSGGQTVLSNALVIAPGKTPAGKNALAVAGVYPAHGNLYSTTTISIFGTNFNGMRGGTYFQANPGSSTSGAVVGRVTVGGVNCNFEYWSPSNLVAYVPPRSAVYSTNETTMATNKLDVVVSGPNGVGVLSNAFAFDLPLPKDGDAGLEKLTPVEQQAQRFLDAIIYATRGPNATNAPADANGLLIPAMTLSQGFSTNGTADTVTRTTTRMGSKDAVREEYEHIRRGVTVNIQSGTNAPPGAPTKTNNTPH